MLSNSNQVFFELTLRDSLTNSLQSVIGKGVSSLRQLDVAGGNLGESLMSSLGGLSTLLPLAGLAAVGGVLSSASEKGMEFTKAMSGVRALLLATDEEFARLNQSAISLGASTVYSSTQIAEAMQVAASAGQDTNQIIESMPGYLNLAASSQVDLATAVGIGLSTMQQFGLKATDMNKIVDQMSFITVKSATGLQDLGEGLKYIGVSAASMKVPLSETLASLGVLADAGEKGSIGARSLSTSIQRLSAPTKAMDEIMGKLNLRFFDSKGEFIGINNSVELLENRMKGFTDEQRANALSVLFGNEAFSEWNILLNKGSSNLKSFTGEIENSQGTADKIAKLQLDNLSGDLESLSGAWESIQLKIFSSIEPFMRGVVQIGSSLLSKFYQSWDTLFAPLSEVKKVFGELFDAVGELFSLFNSGTEDFDLFGISIKIIAEGLKVLLSPLVLAIKTITELINALKLLFQSFGALWTGIKTFASRVMDILLPLGEVFQGVFTLNWDKVKSGASTLTKNFKNIFNEAKDAFVLDLTESMKSNSEKAKGKQEEPANPLAPAKSNVLQNNLQGIAPIKPQSSKIKSNDIDVSGGRAEGKAGKSVVVTINNLVNTLSVNGNTIQDIEGKIKDFITKTLVEAVKDFEVSYA